jgi:hypothetical protein
MKQTKGSTTLFCFSPPIMIATFVIEIVLAGYTLWRYKLNEVTRLVTAILVSLGIFQLAEYMVCETAFGLDSLQWARVGYVAITLLPPLGLHLGLTIAKRKNAKLLAAAYGSAALFAGIFLFAGHGMQGQQCLGNYVIFEIAQWAVWPYSLYYYGWLLGGLYMMWGFIEQEKSLHIRQALIGLAVGYLAFIVPTTAANFLYPETLAGIPSIMCGFAVFLALSLVFWVMPAAEGREFKTMWRNKLSPRS